MRELKKISPYELFNSNETITPPNLEYLDLKFRTPIGAVTINDKPNPINIQESNITSPATIVGNETCQT